MIYRDLLIVRPLCPMKFGVPNPIIWNGRIIWHGRLTWLDRLGRLGRFMNVQDGFLDALGSSTSLGLPRLFIFGTNRSTTFETLFRLCSHLTLSLLDIYSYWCITSRYIRFCHSIWVSK
ncbi:hypothetical protein YC2023_082750 [Brassica napus]